MNKYHKEIQESTTGEVNGEKCSRPDDGNRKSKENTKWVNSGNSKVR